MAGSTNKELHMDLSDRPHDSFVLGEASLELTFARLNNSPIKNDA
jgi:hypothetical protein